MNNIEDMFIIKYEGFEGPVSELIKGIKEDKIDVDKVPITKIINQYMEYVKKKEDSIDLNIIGKTISETTLILKKKSENLLPKNKLENDITGEDEEEDDFSEIEDNKKYIEEYEKYKKVIKYLKERANKQKNVFFPIIDDEIKEDNIEIEKVELSDLLVALEKVLSNKKNMEYIPVKKRVFTVAEKMKKIIDLLKNNQKGTSFNYFMEINNTKLEIIITFLALLQLVNLKKIYCYQNKKYGNIVFKNRGGASNLKKN
ncbi:MAG: ScpA family protein [Candidatus Caldatribacteriota bacterium]|nr:ScpA family protein [Candidatus Caldatribacteriota bacterium]